MCLDNIDMKKSVVIFILVIILLVLAIVLSGCACKKCYDQDKKCCLPLEGEAVCVSKESPEQECPACADGSSSCPSDGKGAKVDCCDDENEYCDVDVCMKKCKTDSNCKECESCNAEGQCERYCEGECCAYDESSSGGTGVCCPAGESCCPELGACCPEDGDCCAGAESGCCPDGQECCPTSDPEGAPCCQKGRCCGDLCCTDAEPYCLNWISTTTGEPTYHCLECTQNSHCPDGQYCDLNMVDHTGTGTCKW